MADNKFFTNTYITNSGRHNYLRIDFLEDPLFTSFTFDIDFNLSPLFYTINSNYYGYPNVEGIAEGIETSLSAMHTEMMGGDKGYDILPLLSANFINDTKLGFGLQQNVFTDLPLYGATEYIYMVDKRNASGSQNDVISVETPKGNSYKLGNNVTSIITDSDLAHAQNSVKNGESVIAECDEIMLKSKGEHEDNKEKMDTLSKECQKKESETQMDESQLLKKVQEYKGDVDKFALLKEDIIKWANSEIAKFRSNMNNIYRDIQCIDEIYKLWVKKPDSTEIENTIRPRMESIFSDYKKEIKSFAEKCKAKYNEFVECSASEGLEGKYFIYDFDSTLKIRTKPLIDKFSSELEYFELKDKDSNEVKGEVKVNLYQAVLEWANNNFISTLMQLAEDNNIFSDYERWLIRPLGYICDKECFANFTSDKTKEQSENFHKYETALAKIRTELYGKGDDDVPCSKSNPTKESPYGQYLEAKDKYENDAYSQAENTKLVTESAISEIQNMSGYTSPPPKEEGKESTNTEGTSTTEPQPPPVTPQTVLDMLGFISGMKKMILEYPYIINGITGLDKAYENNYGIKDPYMGSGDNKITLTCWESLDLRVSSMFNRYFNAIYDRQYRRERVPINLRRFNCSVYVHDVRNFGPKSTKSTDRIVELRDMYFSTIEFKFYDCEIVPEETGNIFNDISNEAPSEMKKTNFTFTYGNCVVNFIPAS